MYESFYNFRRRPFSSAPMADHYFAAPGIEHARQSLVRCIELGQGPALLLGAAGTGKSILCQVIADHFRSTFRTALLANTRLTSRRELLQSILFELDLPYRDMEEGELRLSIVDFLEATPTALLLMIDEAHSLSLRLLEEIRMMTNVTRHGHSKVRLVLAGALSLEEKFASPKLESFNQRVAARCYLQALTREETSQYVRHQLQVVGGEDSVIVDESVLRAVYQATDGVPRLINQVCDYALLLASIAGQRRLSASVIEEAWADLQQLPTPASTIERSEADAGRGTIEFGQLDAPRELPSTMPYAPQVVADTISDNTIMVSGDQLDSIERDMATVIAFEQGDQQPDFGYAKAARSTAQAQKQNPFGDEFTEEEMIIDHYASLEAAGMKRRPQVSCSEGREITAILNSTQVGVPVVRLLTEDFPDEFFDNIENMSDNLMRAVELQTFDVPESAEANLDNDPVLPEPELNEIELQHQGESVDPTTWFSEIVSPTDSAAEFEDAIALAPPLVDSPIRGPQVPIDDRDLLIVEQDSGNSLPVPMPAGTRRQDYRQLFARLRKT